MSRGSHHGNDRPADPPGKPLTEDEWVRFLTLIVVIGMPCPARVAAAETAAENRLRRELRQAPDHRDDR